MYRYSIGKVDRLEESLDENGKYKYGDGTIVLFDEEAYREYLDFIDEAGSPISETIPSEIFEMIYEKLTAYESGTRSAEDTANIMSRESQHTYQNAVGSTDKQTRHFFSLVREKSHDDVSLAPAVGSTDKQTRHFFSQAGETTHDDVRPALAGRKRRAVLAFLYLSRRANPRCFLLPQVGSNVKIPFVQNRKKTYLCLYEGDYFIQAVLSALFFQNFRHCFVIISELTKDSAAFFRIPGVLILVAKLSQNFAVSVIGAVTVISGNGVVNIRVEYEIHAA